MQKQRWKHTVTSPRAEREMPDPLKFRARSSRPGKPEGHVREKLVVSAQL